MLYINYDHCVEYHIRQITTYLKKKLYSVLQLLSEKYVSSTGQECRTRDSSLVVDDIHPASLG